MKILFNSLLFLSLLLVSQLLRSQTDSLDFDSAAELIEKAGELHDKGNYSAAIDLLKKVSPCDPEYPRSCYEMALSYYYSDHDSQALSKCREADFLHYDEPFLYGLLGSLFDDMGIPADGIGIIEKALIKWPYNTNLLYNLGICYLNAGYPEKAEQVLLKSIRYNLYHAKSHMALAKANYAMGRISESYLAYNMGILINPSLTNIREFENAIAGKSGTTPRSYLYPYPEGYDHSRMDRLKALLQSEFAFKDAFEFNHDLNFTVSRQTCMLFTNLKYIESDTSLYNNLYVRFFSDIFQSGRLDLYLHFLLKNTVNAPVTAWINANTGLIEDFVKYAQAFLDKERISGFSNGREKNGISYYHFNDAGNLNSIGEMQSETKIKYGYWIELNNNGGINATGKYSDDKAEGEWILFWPNGNIKQRLVFHEGQLDGLCLTYYPDGSKSGIYPIRHGNKNGHVEEYSASGNLISANNYSDGILNGEGLFNDQNGMFTRKFNYKLDTLSGKQIEKWINDSLKQESYFDAGEYDGRFLTCYANGKPESEFNYERGIKTGKFVKYHFNGTISEMGEYDQKGLLTGEYHSYDRHGKEASVEKEYTSGLLNGICIDYFPDGKIQDKRIYSQDTLKQMECFDSKGNQLYTSELSDNSLYFKSFYPDGIHMLEGKLVKGLKQGSWKKYNSLGLLAEDISYIDGQESGPQKKYFSNGAVKEVYQCDSGKIVGSYLEYYINGHLHTKGQFNREGRNGEWLTYFVNDSIESRSFYVNGIMRGRLLNYSPDGGIVSEQFFNDMGNNTRSIFYDQPGTIQSDLEYEYGSFHFESRFPNGEIRAKRQFCDNTYSGIQESYYPNGQKASLVNYANGRMDGISRYWDYDGNLAGEFRYLLGNPDGEWKWYENGKLSYSNNYENGLYQGMSRVYYYNGKTAREMMFDNDERHGYSDYYAPDGTYMYRLRFQLGQLKGYSWKDPAGKMVPEIDIDRDTRQVVTYYSNGKVSARFGLKNGLYQGDFKTYYSSGKILHEVHYENNNTVGEEKNYYPDGKLREVTNYIENERYGYYCSYYDNGIRQLSGNYLENQKQGEWHAFNRAGKETETLTYFNGNLYEISPK